MPGIVSINGYSAHDKTGVAVVRFDSEDALEAWGAHPEHRQAQAKGRNAFFDSYNMTMPIPVLREYSWSRSAPEVHATRIGAQQ